MIIKILVLIACIALIFAGEILIDQDRFNHSDDRRLTWLGTALWIIGLIAFSISCLIMFN
jgi:hypothetical protein